MSHSNANFRNTNDGSTSTLEFNPGHARVDVTPVFPFVPAIIDMECGDTVSDLLLSATDFHPFYREETLVANMRYNTRTVTFVVDEPGVVEVMVTAVGFTPYITLVRNSEFIWRDEGGVIAIDVTAEQIGPFTLEVSSVEPYGEGSFEVHVSCEPTEYSIQLVITPDPLQFGENATYKLIIIPGPEASPTGTATFTQTVNPNPPTVLGTGVPFVYDEDAGGFVATLVSDAAAGGFHSILGSYSGPESYNGDFDVAPYHVGLYPTWPSPVQIDAAAVAYEEGLNGDIIDGGVIPTDGSWPSIAAFWPAASVPVYSIGGNAVLIAVNAANDGLDLSLAGNGGFGTGATYAKAGLTTPLGVFTQTGGDVLAPATVTVT